MNVLITSVGRRSYIVEYFKDALHGNGLVHVSNSSDITPAFRVADAHVVTPLIYDENYIPFLLDYCKKNKIDILLSLFDIDLYILALNKEKFKEIGVHIIVSDADFVKICNDKWLTYNYLKESSLLVPKTYVDKDIFIKDCSNNIIDYPVIVKPRWGMGSLSIYTADNVDELEILYNKVKKEILTSYMKYESVDNMDEAVLIQEMINGEEYGLDIINDLNGNYVNTIVKQKYAMRSGETDCAKVTHNDYLEKIGSTIGKKTNHIGNLDVDLLYDGKKAYVLEMNARIGGGYPFSYLAGVNLPKALIKWCNNEKLDESILKIKEEIVAHKDIQIVRIDEKKKTRKKI